jgi:hypothetical protein
MRTRIATIASLVLAIFVSLSGLPARAATVQIALTINFTPPLGALGLLGWRRRQTRLA